MIKSFSLFFLSIIWLTHLVAQVPARSAFQKNIDGKQADLVILKNRNGMQVAITNFAARLVSIVTKDRNNNPVDVILGFNSIDEYLNAKSRSYGAIMGRYANRIANGTFQLDGITYQLAKNNNGNNIHGGPQGFNERVWAIDKSSPKKISLSYFSKDGEMGFPGNVKVAVTYRLDNRNRLHIQYAATTDKKTIINLTNHAFFNLNGGGDILNHEVYINAAYFTPVSNAMLPTGEIKPVANTPFDFRKPAIIDGRIKPDDAQLKIAGGYDHNFVLPRKNNKQLAASAYSPSSGIILETYTTEPGIQFFTAGSFKGLDKGKGGRAYHAFAGLCFETQHFPDSPNQPNFPSTELLPGKKFSSHTIYRFGLR